MENLNRKLISNYLMYENFHHKINHDNNNDPYHALLNEILVLPDYINALAKTHFSKEVNQITCIQKSKEITKEKNSDSSFLSTNFTYINQIDKKGNNIQQTINDLNKYNFEEIFNTLDKRISKIIKSKEYHYWNFSRMNLEKNNIIKILLLAEKSKCVQKIVFCNHLNS